MNVTAVLVILLVALGAATKRRAEELPLDFDYNKLPKRIKFEVEPEPTVEEIAHFLTSFKEHLLDNNGPAVAQLTLQALSKQMLEGWTKKCDLISVKFEQYFHLRFPLSPKSAVDVTDLRPFRAKFHESLQDHREGILDLIVSLESEWDLMTMVYLYKEAILYDLEYLSILDQISVAPEIYSILLIFALADGDDKAAFAVLQRHSGTNAVHLLLAIFLERTRVVSLLIKHFEENSRDALYWALGGGNLDIIRQIPEKTIEIKYATDAFLFVCQKGHLHVLECLEEMLEAMVNRSTLTIILIRCAAKFDHVDIFKFLLPKCHFMSISAATELCQDAVCNRNMKMYEHLVHSDLINNLSLMVNTESFKSAEDVDFVIKMYRILLESSRFTPFYLLVMAASKTNCFVLSKFLKFVDPTEFVNYSENPLIEAAEHMRLDNLRVILEDGRCKPITYETLFAKIQNHVNDQCSAEGIKLFNVWHLMPPLCPYAQLVFKAVMMRSYEMLKIIMKDRRFCPPHCDIAFSVKFCSSFGPSPLLEILRQNDTDFLDNALIGAAFGSQVEMVKALLYQGANPNLMLHFSPKLSLARHCRELDRTVVFLLLSLFPLYLAGFLRGKVTDCREDILSVIIDKLLNS